MKHLFLLFIFVSGISNAFAQFNKGDKFAGGSFGLSINTSEVIAQSNNSNFSIHLNPNLGFFVSESAAIGLIPQINFSRSTSTNVNGGKSTTNSLSGGMGVFYRKYFTVAENFSLFFEPRAVYTGAIIRDDGFNNFSLSISPGAAYRISSKWMVEATLGGLLYSRSLDQLGTDQESSDSRFAFDLITTNSVGLIYFFKQKDQ
ncbi:outer membrane beta-barrel protein [Cyclobacterium plantarum]|uniref:Porin family protein n=1 Tax=Cyclobacterium plantarum TaxID=2716263 RepID=A0ABX0HG15_9BACT|nr:outer membrane beta-barrel protein [Cyclobacterium plantarum]NHE59903.1 porin family protein [Cyclobacterium plantarum]